MRICIYTPAITTVLHCTKNLKLFSETTQFREKGCPVCLLKFVNCKCSNAFRRYNRVLWILCLLCSFGNNKCGRIWITSLLAFSLCSEQERRKRWLQLAIEYLTAVNIMITDFLDMTSCTLGDKYQRFGSTLKLKATIFSTTLVPVHQIIWHSFAENCDIYNYEGMCGAT
jgi:hypothetical protein